MEDQGGMFGETESQGSYDHEYVDPYGTGVNTDYVDGNDETADFDQEVEAVASVKDLLDKSSKEQSSNESDKVEAKVSDTANIDQCGPL